MSTVLRDNLTNIYTALRNAGTIMYKDVCWMSAADVQILRLN